MKGFLSEMGDIALVVFIVVTLVLGVGATSLKSTISAAGTHNATNVSDSSSW